MIEEGDDMKKISLSQFDDVYALFQQSFVPSELRPYQYMKDLFQQGLFCIYACYSKQELQGAMIVWELKHCVYLENFAVHEKMRGQGLGSDLMKQFCQMYVNDFLFLEVEEPYDDFSRRRIQFYERMGFILNPYDYIQPTFRQGDQPVILNMMTYPEMMDEQKYQKIKKEIFEVVYQQKGEL